MTTDRMCWAIIPAAGTGTRMGVNTPKQYLPLLGKTVLEHTLQRFCDHPAVNGVVVVLAENDHYWKTVSPATNQKIHTTTGGLKRCHSVLNGLRYLENIAQADDWVMVHDAARPCIRPKDLDKLIHAASGCPDGAILAVPVRDTMKRAGIDSKISETVSRDDLWHALTPQMFRLSTLKTALKNAIEKNIPVTDEAQAVELTGLRPLLVEGHADNIKITHQADLALAETYLAQQERLS